MTSGASRRKQKDGLHTQAEEQVEDNELVRISSEDERSGDTVRIK